MALRIAVGLNTAALRAAVRQPVKIGADTVEVGIIDVMAAGEGRTGVRPAEVVPFEDVDDIDNREQGHR